MVIDPDNIPDPPSWWEVIVAVVAICFCLGIITSWNLTPWN